MRKKLFWAALGIAAMAALALYLLRGTKPGAFKLEDRTVSSGERFSAALQQTVGAPLRPGHRIKLLWDGGVFDPLIADFSAAKRSIHVELFIWKHGALSQRVIEVLGKRREGVACRVLLDAVGSHERGKEVDIGLARVGCELRFSMRANAPSSRNHRKVVVIDARVGYTGGFAFDDAWKGGKDGDPEWRDSAVRVEGPAVSDMQEAFAEDWQEAGGKLLLPSEFPKQPEVGPAKAAFVRSTASPVVTRAERLTQLALAAAHERLWIANAYFAPGKSILDLLARRAAEGTDVRILLPGKKTDSKLAFFLGRRQYGELRKNGVRIWEYEKAMMHSKTMVVDGKLAIIGSVNLDPLSLDRLEDAALVVEDRAVTEELARKFLQDTGISVEQK